MNEARPVPEPRDTSPAAPAGAAPAGVRALGLAARGRRFAGLVGSLAVLVAAGATRWGSPLRPEPRQALTTAAEVRALGSSEARQGRAVRLRGVVTYHDARSGLLIVQDETGAVPIDTAGTGISPSRESLVQVDGVTSLGHFSPVVRKPRLKRLGRGPMPVPRPVSLGARATGAEEYRWVSARGVVRSARIQHDTSLRLALVAPEGPFAAIVSSYEGLEFASLIDAEVSVRGAARTIFGAKREVLRLQVLVPNRSDLSVERLAPADPFSAPRRPIRDALAQAEGDEPGHRVHVRGVVVEEAPGLGLVVEDETGAVRVRPTRMIAVEAGDPVDVLGFPEAATKTLEDATLRIVAPGESGSDRPSPRSAAARRPSLLTSVEAVRRLSPEEAWRGHSVRLRAVVTYYDPVWAVMFVQDATGGIYVDCNGRKRFAVRPGQLVEVEGRTDPGQFAPQVAEPRIRVLGPGSMPIALGPSLDELFSGRLDSQWVELAGVVESVTERDGHVWLDLVAGLYRFRAHTADLSNPALLARLPDARVKVRGACGTLFNEKRQLVGVQVYVPDLSHVSLERPAADPLSAPARSVAGLLQFAPDGNSGHRVRVSGVVTLRQGRGLFIGDDTGALFVGTPDAGSLRVGDRVDAVGFPASRGLSPVLREAVVRKAGRGPEPTPALIGVSDASTGNYDSQLVRLQAYLLDRVVRSGEETLTVQAGGVVFGAHLPDADVAPGLLSLQEGSLLELTGVCSAQIDSSVDMPLTRSFRLLLRSAEDVVVLEEAPWWTLKRTAWAGALLLGGLLAALGWGGTLRRQVRVQTERIRREAQRQAALERRFSDLFENAHDMVFVHDLSGAVREMNRAGERLTGYPHEELLRMGVFELVPPDQRALFRERIQATVSQEAVPPYPLQLTTKDGRRLILEISTRLLRRDGSPVEIQAIARDVTDRHQLEDQLRQAQKMEAVGRLAGGIAHDFNNLLNVVVGHADLLLRRLAPDSSLRRHAQEILKVAETTGSLVQQLLAFGRKQVLQPRILDLGSVLPETARMLRRVIGEDILLQTVLSPGLGRIKADPGQIQQVLMNLAINARDAMPRGGRLTMETGNVELGGEYAMRRLGVRPGPYVRLVVSDTGVGMDAETRVRIFEPFFTTKEKGKGTGLGLATVYGIVTQSGGSIHVYSEPGRGTTFKIYFPRVEEAAEVARVPAPPEEIPSGSEVVLVLEDEDAVRGLVREVLEGCGYTVLEAREAGEGLKLCEEHEGPIDLVLTDVVMPGISGPDFARQAGRLRPEARILYMSGYTDGSIVRQGILQPGAPLIEKPFTSGALARKLREVLAEAPRAAPQDGPLDTAP